jgi:putative membrane protein
MNKIAWPFVILLAVILVLAIGMPFVFLPMSSHMQPYGYGGRMGVWSGGFGILGLVLGLLIIVLLAFAAVLLVQSAKKGAEQSQPPGAEAPLDILKRRYASGELTKEQFEEMKRNLGV